MLTMTLDPHDVDHVRVMLREQLAGDHELIRDLTAFGREPVKLADAQERVRVVESLAGQVGGLY